jgi:NADH-ubiquinone oxidoreductase chain 2
MILFLSLLSGFNSFFITYIEKGVSLYGGLFNITSITQSFQIFILIISALILSIVAYYPRKKQVEPVSLFNTLFNKVDEYEGIINKTSEQFTLIEFALIVIFTVSGATLLISGSDLGSIYLCIELQSFSLYIISSLHRNSESATGSALTYFLLGGLSSCFILLGIGLIYANSGLTNLDGIYSIVYNSEKYVYYSSWYNHTYFFYSLLLISVGLLFKIAAAPFH